MLIGPCVWRLFSQLIKFHINGWDNIGNIIKAHPFNYLWRRLGLLFCGYGSQISPLSSASLKSQILSTYGLYELRYVGTLFFFFAHLCTATIAAARETSPISVLCPAEWKEPHSELQQHRLWLNEIGLHIKQRILFLSAKQPLYCSRGTRRHWSRNIKPYQTSLSLGSACVCNGVCCSPVVLVGTREPLLRGPWEFGALCRRW